VTISFTGGDPRLWLTVIFYFRHRQSAGDLGSNTNHLGEEVVSEITVTFTGTVAPLSSVLVSGVDAYGDTIYSGTPVSFIAGGSTFGRFVP
jgi:hypothetical protein